MIGHEFNPLFRDVIIDRGAGDAVRVGMAVEKCPRPGRSGVSHDTKLSPGCLALNSISRVPARLSDSRATGIVRGGGTGGFLIADWVDLETQITVGEIVVTSGLAGDSVQEESADRFPAGIVIGRVIEVERNEAELFQRAIIQPAVDFDELELAFVITEFTPVDLGPLDDAELAE